MSFEPASARNSGSTPKALPPRHGSAPLAKADAATRQGLDGLATELDFLSAYGAPAAILITAEIEAREQAISPDAALLASGAIDEAFYYRSLARHLRVPFIDEDVALGAGARYPHSIHAGVVPLAGEGPCWLAAPRGAALAGLLRPNLHLASAGLVITTPSCRSRLVQAYAASAIAGNASFGLASFDASFSAKDGLTTAQCRFIIAALAVTTLLFALAPAFAWTAVSLAVNCLFLAVIMLRLFIGSASIAAARTPAPVRIEDRDLPPYSIVVALHREARVVAQLVAALEAIDYPRGKLDIKLVVEEDDQATRLALEALRLSPIYEIVVAPAGSPRTKPRALNVALPLLRGEFMAIFDAEDAPAPIQLREAAQRFLREPRRLACLQARLTIDNVEELLADKAVLDRIRCPVRCPESGNRRAASASGAWRLFEPFPHGRAARGLRLGRLECDGGRRPRPAPRPFRLSRRHAAVQHAGRGAERRLGLADAEATLVERLDADAHHAEPRSPPSRRGG